MIVRAAAALFALVAWRLFRVEPRVLHASRAERAAEPTPATPPLPAAPVETTPRLAPALPVSASQPSIIDVATDGLPFMPAGADAERPDMPVHPHPITAQHQRITRENHLIQTLNDAMDSQDPRALRDALKSYRAEFPEDAQGMQSGYELIANCLEHGPVFREQAKRYFDEERGSSLRRFVRRHCLGGT